MMDVSAFNYAVREYTKRRDKNYAKLIRYAAALRVEKKLREKMLEEYGYRFKDKQYDSVRSKMYKLMDFLLFCNYYRNDVVAGEALVRKLRF